MPPIQWSRISVLVSSLGWVLEGVWRIVSVLTVEISITKGKTASTELASMIPVNHSSYLALRLVLGLVFLGIERLFGIAWMGGGWQCSEIPMLQICSFCRRCGASECALRYLKIKNSK